MHFDENKEKVGLDAIYLDSTALASTLQEFYTGYCLPRGWTHPDLVDLSFLWGYSLWSDGGALGPTEYLVITPEKKEEIDHICDVSTRIPISEIREKLVLPDEYVVRTKDADALGFSYTEAFNLAQMIIYNSSSAFEFVPRTWGAEFGKNLATLLSNQAQISEGDVLSVIELGAGGAIEKWKVALEHYDRKKALRIIITDFDSTIVEAAVAEIRKFACEQIEIIGIPYNLLDGDLALLPKSDLIMGFYVLDSVMQLGDEIWRMDPVRNATRNNVGVDIAKQKYRIRISPHKIGNTRAKQITEEINIALETNTRIPILQGDELEAVVLERIQTKEEVIPREVKELFESQEWPWGWVSRPLGTRNFLRALSCRLNQGGKLIMGDVFYDGVDGLTTPGTIGQRGPLVYQMFSTESFAGLGGEFYTDEQLADKESLPVRNVTYSTHLKYLVISEDSEPKVESTRAFASGAAKKG